MEELIAMCLGTVASFLQGYKGKTKYSPYVRYLIAMGASLFAGALPIVWDMVVQGEVSFDPEQFMVNAGAAFVAGQTYYNIYFKQHNPPKPTKNK